MAGPLERGSTVVGYGTLSGVFLTRSQLYRWYFDWRRQKCREFEFAGCHGNANSFDNRIKCVERCQYHKPGKSTVEWLNDDCLHTQRGAEYIGNVSVSATGMFSLVNCHCLMMKQAQARPGNDASGL